MRSKLWFLCSMLLACLGVGCGDPSVREEERIVRELDTLSATGQHGYFVAHYIVGRTKITRVNKVIHQVAVMRCEEMLLSVPIRLRLLDQSLYEIEYTFKGVQTTLRGTLGEALVRPELEILVSSDDPDLLNSLSTHAAMTWVFKVFRY